MWNIADLGDCEQIEYLKQTARLLVAEETGQVVIQTGSMLSEGKRMVKDHAMVIRFKCPACLSSHHFSYTAVESVSGYCAPCETLFSYNAMDERL